MKKKIIFNLSHRIKLVNERFKKKEYYHYFDEPNNSIIVPILSNKFLLVKQKRIPIKKKNYKFPMGWIDKGESSLQSSMRELLEETGYKSLIKPKKLFEFFSDPGRGSRSCICYYTNKLKKVKKNEKGITTALKSKDELIQLIKNKEFNNASNIAAFYFYLDNISSQS